MKKITIAFSKGRILEEAIPIFEAARVPVAPLKKPGRQLIFESERFRFMIVRASDVPTYVEYGAADLGLVGKDTLFEGGYDLFELLDLKIGICRLSLATVKGEKLPERRVLKIATKYPWITKSFFSQRGRQVEIIKLYGSMEIAPIVGLAHAIVDLVSTGKTLRENNLEEIEVILPYISSMVVSNRKSFYLKNQEISALIESLRKVIGGEKT